jgi:hypothetical protein
MNQANSGMELENVEINHLEMVEHERELNRMENFVDGLLFGRINFLGTYKFLNKCALFVFLIGLLWSILFLLAGDRALPGGPYFSIWILFSFGHVAGFLTRLISVPGLLGILYF